MTRFETLHTDRAGGSVELVQFGQTSSYERIQGCFAAILKNCSKPRRREIRGDAHTWLGDYG